MSRRPSAGLPFFRRAPGRWVEKTRGVAPLVAFLILPPYHHRDDDPGTVVPRAPGAVGHPGDRGRASRYLRVLARPPCGERAVGRLAPAGRASSGDAAALQCPGCGRGKPEAVGAEQPEE